MPMKYLWKLLGIVFPALIWVSCIVPYEPEELVNLDDIIVVEGNISLTGPFSIRITRSTPISSYLYGHKTINIERNRFRSQQTGKEIQPQLGYCPGRVPL